MAAIAQKCTIDLDSPMSPAGIKENPDRHSPSNRSVPDAEGGARGRSASPWGSAPSSARTQGMSTRQAWAPSSIGSAPVRAGYGTTGLRAYENSVMAVTTKQLEALEEKLSSQIAKGISQNKYMCEAAFSRLDSKIQSFEGSQRAVDRKIAELSGNLKGTSEEVRSQLRSIESFDLRLREWRQAIDDESRKRVVEIEQRMQNSSSVDNLVKSSLDDQQKQQITKLHQLENALAGRIQEVEDAFQHLQQHVEARLQSLEAQQHEVVAASGNASLQETLSATAADQEKMGTTNLQLQDKLADALEKVETVSAQTLETHARIEEHGVRLNSMRLKIDGHEQMQRGLGDRLQRAESKVEEVKVVLSEKTRQLDLVSGASQQVTVAEKILEGMQEQVQELHQHIFGARAELSIPPPSPPGRGSMGSKIELGQTLRAVLQAFIDRFEAFDDELVSLKGDGLGPRVNALVEQLTGIVPKIVHHDHVVKEIQAQIKNGPVAAPATQSLSGKPLVGFDFDCTITVRHYYKCLAWGLAYGNEGAHQHCKVLFDWLRAHNIAPRVPQQESNLDAVVMVTEFLIHTLGAANFRTLFRDIFLGGEERIACLTAWLQEKHSKQVEFAIITAGIASAVSMALEVAMPEWKEFFTPDKVMDISHSHRHQVGSVAGAKALLLRDRCPAGKPILLVDDSLCRDPVPEWIARSASIESISLPYEGAGLETKVFLEIDAALVPH